MSYLSQALIPKPEALQERLVDGYAWHNAIWSAFPGRPDDARDFLFRLDLLNGGFRVLLLSAQKPLPTEVFSWQTKSVSEGFLEHDTYRFQLKANPTLRRSADKRRLAIYDEAQLRDWLTRKAATAGFEVDPDTLQVGAPLDETFVRNGRRGKHVAVDFTGMLRITDRQLFSETFHSGIGSAKGFGYGMLMLQPIQ